MEQIIQAIDEFILDVYGPTELNFEPSNIGITAEQYNQLGATKFNDMVGLGYMAAIQHFVSIYHTHVEMRKMGEDNDGNGNNNNNDENSQKMKKIVDMLTEFLQTTYGMSVEPTYLGPTEKEFEFDDDRSRYAGQIGLGFRFATSHLKSIHITDQLSEQFKHQPQPQPQQPTQT